jgi:hypothetical protein
MFEFNSRLQELLILRKENSNSYKFPAKENELAWYDGNAKHRKIYKKKKKLPVLDAYKWPYLWGYVYMLGGIEYMRDHDKV